MNSIEKIREDIEQSFILLEQVIATCSNEVFNRRPASRGWTIGEIMEHLWLIESMLNKQFGGTSNSTEREADKKVAIIKTVFEETTNKYESPSFFIPSNTVKDKTSWLEKIQIERKLLYSLAGTLDLTETLLAFKHPHLGALTRYEWVYFIILHSNRHLLQIKNVIENN
jgi:hypothetical protein